MTPIELRNDLRTFLREAPVSIRKIEKKSGINRSWLSKFRAGVIDNPTIKQLHQLYKYRTHLTAVQNRRTR